MKHMSIWARAIILVDMDAFFAAIEQRDCSAWQGRPLVVTNGRQGSCIITSSYEARAYGIKTGMRLYEAYRLCPDLIQASSRPSVYTQVSRKIMAALRDITPDVEVFSVDEAFLDVTGCQRLYGSIERCAVLVQQTIARVSGLSCSVGVSRDKITAKFAATCSKPRGITIIPPSQLQAWLQDLPVTHLCGIGPKIGRFLAQHGVITCGDMAHLPISVLGKRFGALGRRLWLMCQGMDNDPVRSHMPPVKSLSHSKILPPNTQAADSILAIMHLLTDRLCARLRANHLCCNQFWLGFKDAALGWQGSGVRRLQADADALLLWQDAQKIFKQHWLGGVVLQLKVVALNPTTGQQLSWLNEADKPSVDALIDSVQQRFGSRALQRAHGLSQPSPVRVISPAWRDSGVRDSIDDIASKKKSDDAS